jgi:DeoR family fructose operon transcriptional repressor
MTKEHRWNKIAELCKEKGQISVEELSEELSVSPATIRRDLQQMEDLKIISRFHGGARISQKQYDEPHMILKQETNSDKKKSVALLAASLIEDNQMVYLDAGSTTYGIIQYIHAKNITVVTPGIRHITALISRDIPTIVLGGPIRPETEAIAGRNTVEQIGSMFFDVCFIGTNGIHEKNGFTTSNEMEAATKAAAIRQTKTPYIVTDCSKFHVLNPVRFAKLEDVTVLTDSVPDDYLSLPMKYIVA